uniref:Uncharacterized protein n=1 Tax=Rhizophora mucronata TaxID=61149 RepID=A0A2P2QVZ4_RHIMU
MHGIFLLSTLFSTIHKATSHHKLAYELNHFGITDGRLGLWLIG